MAVVTTFLSASISSFIRLLITETVLLACNYEHVHILMPYNPLEFDSGENNAM